MGTIKDLASRAEAGSAEMQRELLAKAWDAVYPSMPVDSPLWPKHDRFFSMLDCGAYESAALMLVPERADWAMNSKNLALVGSLQENVWLEGAETPALAIVAACLRAHTKGEG